MKSVFKKLFGQGETPKQAQGSGDEPLDFGSEPKPLDERFASNFTSNGGCFLYCENQQKALEYFKRILAENSWASFNCPERDLATWLSTLNLSPRNSGDAEANLMYCECMVARKGSVVLSSHQTFGKKLSDLPDNYVIVGKVDQLVDTVSDGLRFIKAHKSGNIPSGITSITGKKAGQAISEDLSIPKNIYLLLIEN